MSDIKPSDLRIIAAEKNIRKQILRDGCEQAADKIDRLEAELEEAKETIQIRENSWHQACDKLAIAQAELEKHKWRTDIENAPRDGTRFLAYQANRNVYYEARWANKFSPDHYADSSAGWYAEGYDCKGYPTHWKPLEKPEV